MRVAAAADLHFHPGREQAVAAMLEQIADQADVLLIAGDLTDTGTKDEALALVEVLGEVSIPIVAVLGNHDYHHQEQVAICQTLARRDADFVIAMTHYSPTLQTMSDEPESLHPFLGSSDLGDTLDRHQVHFAIHGHAHIGRHEGQTPGGVSVFNVALPLIERPRVWQLEPSPATLA